MNERLDALLSARRDDALTPAERAELDRLLSESDSARRRALALDRVDEGLHALAAASVEDERLARNLTALQRRTPTRTVSSPLATRATTARPASDRARRVRSLGLGVGLAAAAMAAAWIAALVLPNDRLAGDAIDGTGGSGSARDADGSRALAVVDSVAAEDLAALGLEEAGDLEVIEALELLEFLADRERMAEGPQG